MPMHRVHAGRLLSKKPDMDGYARQEPHARVCVVMLLTDGEPSEPAEAVCTAAWQALKAAPAGDATLLSMALGEGSQPTLMELAAQCGRGVSLYVSDNTRLPGQFGRMWGYICSLTDLHS